MPADPVGTAKTSLNGQMVTQRRGFVGPGFPGKPPDQQVEAPSEQNGPGGDGGTGDDKPDFGQPEIGSASRKPVPVTVIERLERFTPRTVASGIRTIVS